MKDQQVQNHLSTQASNQQYRVTTHNTEPFSIQNHLSRSRKHLLVQQNELLNQAVELRDRQIQQLKQFLSKYKEQSLTKETKPQPQWICLSSQNKQHLSKTILSLNEQLQEIQVKYDKSCQKINELEAKIRQILNKSQSQQQQLKQEIQSLKQDKKYQRDESQRIVDNMRIKFQQKLTCRLKLQEQKSKKEKALLEEQISHLKDDINQKNLQIARLTDKLRSQKDQSDSHCKFVENQNKQFKKKLQILQIQLKNEFKTKQHHMLEQFTADIDSLHQEQRQQIEILCQRITSLKQQLAQKDQQLRQEYWQSRDLYVKSTLANGGNSSLKTEGDSINKSFISTKLKTEGSNFNKMISNQRKQSNEKSKESEHNIFALRQYMK